MNNATTVQAPEIFTLPVRLAFDAPGAVVIMGTPGSYGDAGWGVVHCVDREDALRVMRDYPAAWLPCWTRIERAA